MFNRLLIGRYIKQDSWIHRLDPRTKLVLSLVFILLIFFAKNPYSYGALLGFTFLAIYLSRIPFKFFFDGIKPVVALILLTVLFQVFFTGGGEIYWQWGPLALTAEGLINGVYIFLRLVMIITMSTLLTLTTSPIELTDGIEYGLRPLARFGFPAHEVALMLSIALRYVPTLMDEAEKIMNAQKSRGVNFEEGPLLSRLRAVVPLLVPLFVSAFNRAEEMAVAMEARGYQGGEGRTKYRVLRFSRADAIAVGAVFLMFPVVIYLAHYF